MELKQYVKETLLQIIDGVKEAQEEALKKGAIINPVNIRGGNATNVYINDNSVCVNNIDFEVEISTTDETNTTTGVGIYVAGLGLGTKNNDKGKNLATNKLAFSVPTTLPTIEYDENNTPLSFPVGKMKRNNVY
jgi:hypothetical protein